MLGITDLSTYLIGTIIIVLLPGPNSMYVLSVAAQRGVRRGFVGACGIFLGDAILMTLTAAGAASVLKAYPAVFAVVKYSGGAYLGWLGLQMLRGAWRSWRETGRLEAAPQRQVDDSRPFARALTISLMNPKAILFYVSFFIQFVSPNYDYPGLSFLILGCVVQVCSMLYLSALIFGGAFLAETFRRRRKLSATTTGGVGSLFIGFGAKLAGASLS